MSSEDLRTNAQNSSLHLWCEELARELNNRGLTFKKVVKESFDLDWNKDMVKKVFWHTLAKAKFGKESTTELTRGELQDIYDEIMRFLSDEKFDGIYLPFPSAEIDYQLIKKLNDF